MDNSASKALVSSLRLDVNTPNNVEIDGAASLNALDEAIETEGDADLVRGYLESHHLANPFARLWLANYHRDRGRLSRAVEHFLHAVSLTPDVFATLTDSEWEYLCEITDDNALIRFRLAKLRFYMQAAEESGEALVELYCQLVDDTAGGPWQADVTDLGREIEKMRRNGEIPRTLVRRR